MVVVERGQRLHAHQHILDLEVFFRGVVDVVCRDASQAKLGRKLGKLGIEQGRAGEHIVLHLDQEVVPPENVYPLMGGDSCFFEPVPQDRAMVFHPLGQPERQKRSSLCSFITSTLAAASPFSCESCARVMILQRLE